MFRKIKPYLQLMRLHKPIGNLLLLWPTFWALWIAANGTPHLKNIFIFATGVILMRAAGCVINDIADRKLDCFVSRTKNRPLTCGKISTRHAIYVLCALCAIALVLVLLTNMLTIILSFFAVLIAMIYPFMKRYTHWPQLILGIAFSCGIPMAFAAEIGKVPFIAFILMLANIAWTIAYDTQYAMVDREDDLEIGIKSTAILFGKYDRLMIGVFQSAAVLLLGLIGVIENFSCAYFLALFLGMILFSYQQCLTYHREAEKCFHAFLNNQWVGMVVFMGIFLR